MLYILKLLYFWNLFNWCISDILYCCFICLFLLFSVYMLHIYILLFIFLFFKTVQRGFLLCSVYIKLLDIFKLVPFYSIFYHFLYFCQFIFFCVFSVLNYILLFLFYKKHTFYKISLDFLFFLIILYSVRWWQVFKIYILKGFQTGLYSPVAWCLFYSIF